MTAETINIQKDNQTLISLAIKCKFITSNQEQEILSKLIEAYQENSNYSVVDIFKADHILSQEKIDFLFAIKKHLAVKMLDKKFGQLGVNNYFIKPQAVEKAIYLQEKLFKEKRKSKKIGDILLDNQEITLANKTAILLTQDRIQDHLLEQSMAELATSEIEKININMRFGAIAVKKKMITIDQLNQALKLQKRKRDTGQKMYLGEIFQELFGMPEHEIMQILNIQKKLEKKRLSLEKAIARYQSELSTIKRLNELFQLSVTKNKMNAYVHRIKDSFEQIEVRHFNNWLRLNGIQFGVCSNEIINAFLEQSDDDAKLKIATGIPPSPTYDEIVEFFFDTDVFINRDKNQEQISQYVKKGDLLAKITPPKLGESGKNVFGHPVSPSKPKIFPIAFGEGVLRKGTDFFAAVDGIPILFKKRRLFVTPDTQSYPVKTYTGDIKTDTREDYRGTNLKMEGNIFETGIVNCHHLAISGNVSGKIFATGDIEVKGCIGKEMKEKITSRTHLQANGDITIKKAIANSEIITSKSLMATKSDIISCNISAFQDIFLKNVYSSPAYPSTLQIGMESNVKIDSINRIITEQTMRLKKLQRTDQLDKLTAKFQKKIHAQNDYLEKQNVLNYLQKICNAADLDHIEHIEQKIQIFEPSVKSNPNNVLSAPNSDSSLAYMDEVVLQIKGLSPEDQKKYITEKLVVISDLYKAAINATDRFSSEHKAKFNFIMKKVHKNQSEIDQIKQQIDELLGQKDYLALTEKMYNPLNQSVIKIKNLIEKGTIIKGRKASKIIKENAYGVKIRETKELHKKNYKIIIEGYYD